MFSNQSQKWIYFLRTKLIQFENYEQSDDTIAVNYWYDREYDQSYTKEKFINELIDHLEVN